MVFSYTSEVGCPSRTSPGASLVQHIFNDIFFLLNETEICNYADDTTIYCLHHELQEGTIRLDG